MQKHCTTGALKYKQVVNNISESHYVEKARICHQDIHLQLVSRPLGRLLASARQAGHQEDIPLIQGETLSPTQR